MNLYIWKAADKNTIVVIAETLEKAHVLIEDDYQDELKQKEYFCRKIHSGISVVIFNE